MHICCASDSRDCALQMVHQLRVQHDVSSIVDAQGGAHGFGMLSAQEELPRTAAQQ